MLLVLYYVNPLRNIKEILTPINSETTEEYWKQRTNAYRELFNIADNDKKFFAIVDLSEPRIEFCSSQVYDFLGFNPHHITISNIFQLIHPDDAVRYTLDELRIAGFLKQLPAEQRCRYKFSKQLRIRNSSGRYVTVCQQMVVLNEAGPDNMMRALVYVSSAINCIDNAKLRISALQSHLVDSSKEPDQNQAPRDAENPLSDREMEILQLLAQNMSTKEIADKISRSPHTVKNHRKNMLRKSGTSTTLELILLAKKKSWL